MRTEWEFLSDDSEKIPFTIINFIGLSHNTVRGAAGGAVLCAETLTAKGFITKK